jgi:SAM-dependent methyltransferase
MSLAPDQTVVHALHNARSRESTYVRCPVCDGASFSGGLRNLPELRFGLAERHSVVRCRTCGTYVTQPAPDPAHLAELYERHYVPPEYVMPDKGAIALRVGGLQAAQPELREQWAFERSTEIPALLLQAPTAKYFADRRMLLDVGAYTGENMVWLEAAGWHVLGVEPNPNAAAVGRQIGLDVHQGYLEECELADNAFDAAYLSYVIEHVTRPNALLAELHRVIKPGGRLLLTTHNVHSIWRYVFGRYWIHWHTPFHLYHTHPGALRRLARRAGFAPLYVSTRTPTFWLLMSIRAMRDCLMRRRPHQRLYDPLLPHIARRLHRMLAIEGGRVQGDCTIAIFERLA